MQLLDAAPMTPHLVWSQDDILAYRSGYHVLADYLDAPRVVRPRYDPAGGLALLQTRINRRLAFSRWCSGGSLDVEKELGRLYAQGELQAVHYLWCDRDLAFLDVPVRFIRLRIIGTFHQCADDLPRVIRRPSSLRHFAAIILMSETQRGYFLQHGVQPERLHVIHHGVDVDHFAPASLESSEEFTVLSVGGTRRDYTQMRAVAEACAADAAIHFKIIGPEDKAHHFSGLSNLTYQSRVSDDELLSLYRRASCFLHLPENATANNAMLEALACGAPIISQQVGGVPEYVTADCGFLNAAGDTSGTILALRRLAKDRALQSQMRHAARDHALKYDWRVVAEQTREVYCRAA